MPRSYEHISKYENEIIELRGKGKSRKEICNQLGISEKQLHNFIPLLAQLQLKRQ